MSDINECYSYGCTTGDNETRWYGEVYNRPNGDGFAMGADITIRDCIAMPSGGWRAWSFDDAKRWLEWDIERNRGGR